jgi:hypothetical protein
MNRPNELTLSWSGTPDRFFTVEALTGYLGGARPYRIRLYMDGVPVTEHGCNTEVRAREEFERRVMENL